MPTAFCSTVANLLYFPICERLQASNDGLHLFGILLDIRNNNINNCN